MKYLFLGISIVLTFLAFAMSFQTGEISSNISSSFSLTFYDLFTSIFQHTTVSFTVFHTWIRKLAHITEYFLLGVSWLITAMKFHVSLYYALFIGLAIACIDEGIQFFSPDRGPSLIDIFLFDYSSYLVGHFITKKLLYNKNKVSL